MRHSGFRSVGDQASGSATETVVDERQRKLTSTRKATFIVRLWTDDTSGDDSSWRGTAEHIGSGQSCRFRTLDEFLDWLRLELGKAEEKPES